MRPSASFELVGLLPEEVATRLSNACELVGGKPAGAMIFLCGALAQQVLDVGRAIQTLALSFPVLLSNGAGVLTERGEHERISAAAGIVWRGGSCEPFALDIERSQTQFGARIAEAANRALGAHTGAVGLFATRDTVSANVFLEAPANTKWPNVFGGGCLGNPGVVVVSRGRVLPCDVGGLAIRGFCPPVTRASPACALLGDLQPVTQVDGPIVLRIGDRVALDVLKSQASQLQGRRLVVLAVEVGNDRARRPRLVVRGIRGVHEGRGGLMISEDVTLDSRIAFATVDSQAAREDLEACLREAAREVRGAQPVFGVYVNCAGRGSELHGEGNVDSRMIRARWTGLPVAGVNSAFEIGPGRGGATAHLYSGVLTLFSSAS